MCLLLVTVQGVRDESMMKTDDLRPCGAYGAGW